MNRITLSIFAAALAMMPLSATAQGNRAHKERGCVQECRTELRSCTQVLHTEYRMCADATCSEEAAAAETACEADVTAEACIAAREALSECLDPCSDAAKASRAECRGEATECITQCPEREPLPEPGSKDPTCVRACHQSLSGCVADARESAGECSAECADDIDETRGPCAHGNTRACQNARSNATKCLKPCNRALRDAVNACTVTARQCAQECPGSEDPGTEE